MACLRALVAQQGLEQEMTGVIYGSPQFLPMKKLLLIVILLSFILTSCNTWHIACPGFPSVERAESVLNQYSEFFEGLEKENGLTYGAVVATCPQGGYIRIYHGGRSQIEPVLKAMDEINAREEGPDRFFGIPFLFPNV